MEASAVSAEGAKMRTFDERTRALEHAARGAEDISGLILLGSAAVPGRRDEWSDHDFFVIARPGAAQRVREVEKWLPDMQDVVLIAREWDVGFSVLYDDGHLFEFAAASAAELDAVSVGDHAIVFDDDGSLAAMVEAARLRAAAATGPDPVHEARLMLVKLLVGVGRARRGELVNAGQFVRTWAVNHYIGALRARHPVAASAADRLDPTRRLERDYPDWGRELAAVLERPVEAAAQGLLRLARTTLEPDWPDFPSRAADAVAARLGW
jgi:hypothetical protein